MIRRLVFIEKDYLCGRFYTPNTHGMTDICCIGHITLDKIITPQHTSYMPGGTAYYFSRGMASLHAQTGYKLITALSSKEYPVVDELRKAGINVDVLPSRHTVYFENRYEENSDKRTQRVLAKADPFTIDALRKENARFFHLGSLLADDFPTEVIEYLSGKAILSVDAQGYLREVKGDKVSPADWPEKQEVLKYIDILKVNEHEAEVLTGYADPKHAAEQLSAWGVKEVLLTLGSLGSIILADGLCYKIPAYPPRQTIDATGCGDTYVMGYLYMRNKGVSYPDAGCFAAALSTLKLEKSGPLTATAEEAYRVIDANRSKVEIL